jgi:hypothetical protein
VSIEDLFHELDEKKRALDREIESLKENIGLLDCNIEIMKDDFKTEVERISSFSSPRSGLFAEKVAKKIEKGGKERAKAIELRDSLSKDLQIKIKERDKVLLEREKLQEHYPSVCFRLHR